jgi:hypothetical protein
VRTRASTRADATQHCGERVLEQRPVNRETVDAQTLRDAPAHEHPVPEQRQGGGLRQRPGMSPERCPGGVRGARLSYHVRALDGSGESRIVFEGAQAGAEHGNEDQKHAQPDRQPALAAGQSDAFDGLRRAWSSHEIHEGEP